MRRRRLRALTLGALLASTLLTACGGDPAADPAPTAASSPSASPSDEPSESPDSSGSAAPAGAPQPIVQGARLLDARTGRPWIPHGVSWSGFEYSCAQGRGSSPLDALGSGAEDAEAAALASWRIDVVRLPLNLDCWLGTQGAPVGPGATAPGYRDAVRAFVTALHAQGMAVILDLHSRKRFQEDEFGNPPMPDADALTFWDSVAAEYATDPSVMFDAWNEPYARYDERTGTYPAQLTWACWAQGGCPAYGEDDRVPLDDGGPYQATGMRALVGAIRDAGATQPILLGGLDYANDLREWVRWAPDDPSLVAALHTYPDKRCASAACFDRELLPILRTRPVLISEVGDGDSSARHVRSVSQWAAAHDVGWLAWAWEADPDNAFSLVAADRRTPSRPYGERVRALLEAATAD